MLGANFAARLVDMLRLEHEPTPLPTCAPGLFYIRHQIEVVGDLNRYADLLKGEANLADDVVAPASEMKSFA